MKSENRNLTWAWLVAALLFFALGTHSAMATPGTIVGSKHDFSKTTGPSATYKSATETQICVYCHAPHNAAAINAPLWNHAQTAVSSYTLYTSAISSTMNATTGQPGQISKLCLSCHDGTVAVDNFGGSNTTALKVTGTALMGTDLSNDHPIGFVYSAALATTDGGLRDPSAVDVTIGTGNTGTIESKMLFGATGSAKVECASCHDVHNSTGGTADSNKLVRVSTAGSALCLACHIK